MSVRYLVALIAISLRFVDGQSGGSEINSNTSLYVVDIAQDELLNPILASLNPFVHLSRRPSPTRVPVIPLPSLQSSVLLITSLPSPAVSPPDQTPILPVSPSTVLISDFTPMIWFTSSVDYSFLSTIAFPFGTSSLSSVIDPVTSVLITPDSVSDAFLPIFITPTPTVTLEMTSSVTAPMSTVQMQLDDGTTFPPTTPDLRTLNDTRLVIRPLRPTQTVSPVLVVGTPTTPLSTSRPTTTTTTFQPPTTTVTTVATPLANEMLRIVIAQPRWDRTNSVLSTYRTRMEAGLLKVFQEADRRYVSLLEDERLISNATNITTPGFTTTVTPVSNVTIIQINGTSLNGTAATQVDFILLHTDLAFGPQWSVLNASDGLERVNLLSNDEISSILGSVVLQRPSVISGLTQNSSRPSSASISSPDYYGIIVGVSTAAAVLLAICLVWLLLCIWIRCIRKPPKTVPTLVSHHFTATQTSLPSLRPQPGEFKDQGIQTVLMPRKKSLVPGGPLEQLPNPLQLRGTKETTFIQKSFSDKQPTPDRGVRISESRPVQAAFPSRTQPIREIPVANSEQPRVQSRDRTVNRPEDAMIKGGAGRVKLISVIKTNHIDPNYVQGISNRKPVESPRSRFVKIRSGYVNNGYEPQSHQRSPEYKRTVGEIKRELRNWEIGNV
ncbi:mucin-2-like [Paramacrobiotus metropolitanus]|uniref:mucin-2-like n=1 Tax=Paramacrobiotus metropolitanus TaxID=2943436 RepID=UPI002445CC09|nr:mucin-2-like [Paramacrobiotus metropolitanus]